MNQQVEIESVCLVLGSGVCGKMVSVDLSKCSPEDEPEAKEV